MNTPLLVMVKYDSTYGNLFSDAECKCVGADNQVCQLNFNAFVFFLFCSSQVFFPLFFSLFLAVSPLKHKIYYKKMLSQFAHKWLHQLRNNIGCSIQLQKSYNFPLCEADDYIIYISLFGRIDGEKKNENSAIIINNDSKTKMRHYGNTQFIRRI